MFDYKWLLDRIDRILLEVNGQLSDEKIADVHELANAGEWQLAFEILCDNLYEQDITTSETTYKMLHEVGTALNLDTKTWEILKPDCMG